MKTRIIFFTALIIFGLFVACEEESNDENVISDSEAITSNRWIEEGVWEDYCEDDSEIITGIRFLTFQLDKNVLWELELVGETYGCEGDSEIIGTWQKEGENYSCNLGGQNYDITISEDGQTLCMVDSDQDEECYAKE